MDNEDIPYRSSAILESVKADTTFSKDEEQQTTLRSVHKAFKEAVANLDSWHAFDISETELKIKQQIKSHQMAYDIVTPLLDVLTQALETIDTNFKSRNKK